MGNNTTLALAVRPGYANQNSGEQILWENGTKYSGVPLTATTTSVTFAGSSFFSDPGLNSGNYDAVIVNGTGLGQHRQIVSCAGGTITVAPAWNVAPDATSTVIIAGVVSHCAVYHNSLQGKSDYATRVTASAGIEPYGNSYDFIADGNTISQTRTGIYLWGMSETTLSPQSIDCVYFNYIANNSIRDCVNGGVGVSQAWDGWPADSPYPGISYLGNSCSYNTVEAMSNAALLESAETAPVGDQVDLNIFDHDVVTNSPAGISQQQAASAIRNTISYKNTVSLKSAAK